MNVLKFVFRVCTAVLPVHISMAGKSGAGKGGAKIQFCVLLKSGLICWGLQSRESQLQCQYWGKLHGGVGEGWRWMSLSNVVSKVICILYLVCCIYVGLHGWNTPPPPS